MLCNYSTTTSGKIARPIPECFLRRLMNLPVGIAEADDLHAGPQIIDHNTPAGGRPQSKTAGGGSGVVAVATEALGRKNDAAAGADKTRA